MDLALTLMAIIGGTVGIVSTIYCTISLPAVIIWKFYRKVKYNISIFD
ncbi:hypothetical protein [Anaerosporobacter faecicola]|nr:hypothetical protein [Anaerosporobacter faecicola]